jgi:hypothetical protein
VRGREGEGELLRAGQQVAQNDVRAVDIALDRLLPGLQQRLADS